MQRYFLRLIVLILSFTVGIGAQKLADTFRVQPSRWSATAEAGAQAISLENTSMLPQPANNLPPCPPIRSIDFGNFRYHGWPIFGSRKKSFTLRDWELPAKFDKHGWPEEIGLGASVYYADVTGDFIEDAIIIFDEDIHGSAIVSAVYIYTLEFGKPKMLWGFEAGDRADGGLKGVYVENGELVIELEGKNKVIGKNLYEDDGTKNGDCCPRYFTRTRYRWNGKRFEKSAQPEVLPLTNSIDRFPDSAECR